MKPVKFSLFAKLSPSDTDWKEIGFDIDEVIKAEKEAKKKDNK